MPGKIVETEYGQGKTKDEDKPIASKVLVYFEDGTTRLIPIEKLKIIDCWD